MDLNQLQLSPALLAALYPDTLVTAGDATALPMETPTPVTEASGTPRSLGNNQRQILVMVNHPDAVFLPDTELRFLMGVLNACKLSMDDIALVNRHHHPDMGYKTLLAAFNSRIVLLFDIEPADFGLPLHFPQYQLQSFAQATFIAAPALGKLENDKAEKLQLWTALKRLFNL